jgi:hypothetical protein
VPVLKLPKLDDMTANLTNEASSSSSASTSTSGSSSGQAAAAAAAGAGAAAQSPRPSALGRIYEDSLISAYISKLQVRDCDQAPRAYCVADGRMHRQYTVQH